MELSNTGVNEIVLVDDDEMQHYIIRKYLERNTNKYALHSFSDGEEFLSYLNELSNSNLKMLAIVLLDIRMPNVDGFEVLKRIRSDDRFNDGPPILMFSNSDAPPDIEKSKQLGANGFQTKPSSVKDLDNFFTILIHGREI